MAVIRRAFDTRRDVCSKGTDAVDVADCIKYGIELFVDGRRRVTTESGYYIASIVDLDWIDERDLEVRKIGEVRYVSTKV